MGFLPSFSSMSSKDHPRCESCGCHDPLPCPDKDSHPHTLTTAPPKRPPPIPNDLRGLPRTLELSSEEHEAKEYISQARTIHLHQVRNITRRFSLIRARWNTSEMWAATAADELRRVQDDLVSPFPTLKTSF